MHKLPIYYSLCVQSVFVFWEYFFFKYFSILKQIKDYESEAGHTNVDLSVSTRDTVFCLTYINVVICWTQLHAGPTVFWTIVLFDYFKCICFPNIWNCRNMTTDERSWSWSYGSWIYNYLCNQCLSPLMLWVWILQMVSCTRYNIMW